MLCLTRKEGQWTTFIHEKSGDPILVRVTNIKDGKLRLVISDDARNYVVTRPEAGPKKD